MAIEAGTKNYRAPEGSQKVLTWKGKKIRANADWMILRNKEKPIAEVFHVHYALVGGAQAAKRPITFVFNGGPGASSCFLHVGALGPKRVQFGEHGQILPPPSLTVENQESWLPFTDLVFVDPVGTGFSRALDEVDTSDPNEPALGKDGAPKEEPKPKKEFYGVKRDLESMGEFIQRFLSEHNLWSRPVYIAGESYGGFRVAKLSRLLSEKYGIGLRGSILISPAIEFQGLNGTDYDILQWVEAFPTLAMVAKYHSKSRVFDKKSALAPALKAAQEFAVGPYASALVAGELMPSEALSQVWSKAADFLGLPVQMLEHAMGRVHFVRFARYLLRDQNQLVGFYDGAATGADVFPDRDEFVGPDPTLAGIDRVFAGGINQQIREVLGVKTTREYRIISEEVFGSWKRDDVTHYENPALGAMDDLRYAMALSPDLKVWIAHGYYDMVTPYFSANRLAAHMRLPAALKNRIKVHHFEGGHMFYSWKASRLAFTKEAAGFYR